MSSQFRRSRTLLAITLLLSLLFATPSFALLGLFEKKEMSAEEKQETIENIQSIQEKLKLLQEKLRALERRKAMKQAAEQVAAADERLTAGPDQVNWLPIDNTVGTPGDFGTYTYLLFHGDIEDMEAVGALEDFILTIETLPEVETPPSLANRFLVPVETPQSTIDLGRQPYDFKLNDAYLQRLGLDDPLSKGPVLVSLAEPLDPYGIEPPPAFLAVSLGHQVPIQSKHLATLWHNYEKDAVAPVNHKLENLFWQLLDGQFQARVSRNGDQLVVVLPE